MRFSALGSGKKIQVAEKICFMMKIALQKSIFMAYYYRYKFSANQK